jgi:DNA invertase Pin-like site-specific DNA recombinase
LPPDHEADQHILPLACSSTNWQPHEALRALAAADLHSLGKLRVAERLTQGLEGSNYRMLSGKRRIALKVLVKGDTLVVTRLDRLGRSLRDLANIAHEIEEAGAHLRVLEQSVDTATSAGRAFGMLAVFAQFETDFRRDRQAEGIASAKKAAVYTGGKPRIDRRAVLDLLEAGEAPQPQRVPWAFRGDLSSFFHPL